MTTPENTPARQQPIQAHAETATFSQFQDFTAASEAVLKFLQGRLPFGLWMITRTEGDDWIVLDAEDRDYGVQAGSVFRWTDSFCSRMVRGEGPRIAPDAASVPAYASAPIGRQVPIKAYVGVPLTHQNGSLFGTLCAIDPESKPESITSELPLLELLAQLLSSLLALELAAQAERRRAERAEATALKDALTELYNRRGWDQLIEREENRCRRYGHPAAVFIVDLDDLKKINDTQGHDAGDRLITQAAQALKSAARDQDIIARIGGDEFALLAVECDDKGRNALAARIAQAFAQAGVRASTGYATRNPSRGLQAAVNEADAAMYVQKQARRNPA
jgi:diguanylate cyclase